MMCIASNERDIQSITSINILKRDCGNDTEIGKCVNFKIIDLTCGKKFWRKFKESILWYEVKGKSMQDILQEQSLELKRCNILIITSDRKINISDKESSRLEDVIETLSSLGLSKVSVLKGGLKSYLTLLP